MGRIWKLEERDWFLWECETDDHDNVEEILLDEH